MHVDNAIILAAGISSRFAPLSYEKPKALFEIKGEILIERQIKQLKDAGIDNIIIVVGYKKDLFSYLVDKYNVILVENKEYLSRNNQASIYVAKEYLKNTYVCSADNYFINNPFANELDESYYASIYVSGNTNEWCIQEEDGYIVDVHIGGENSWIMLGHTFWSESFSRKFINILENEYHLECTKDKLWEQIYLEHIDELKMKIQKYPDKYILEFDTLDDLRQFDTSYVDNTRSKILRDISEQLNISESSIGQIKVIKGRDNMVEGFSFYANGNYTYYYKEQQLIRGGE